MEILDKRSKNKNTVAFSELAIGAVYEDEYGEICIKFSNNQSEDNALVGDKFGHWKTAYERDTMMVTPLKTTLVIEREE